MWSYEREICIWAPIIFYCKALEECKEKRLYEGKVMQVVQKDYIINVYHVVEFNFLKTFYLLSSMKIIYYNLM